MRRSVEAADLPVRAAAPVDYVRVCPAQGTGFFFIPGTETCLRIGGLVRFEARSDERPVGVSRDHNDFTFFARGQAFFDARTATEFGTLRSFVRINADQAAGTATTVLDQGFIQFAGLTAGRVTSFFDFWGGGLLRGGLQSDGTVELIAYTAQFADGWSATVSVENPRRANRVVRAAGASTVVGGVVVPGVAAADLYGGRNMPALVGNLRVQQGWGAAQIAGVVNQVRVSEVARTLGFRDRTGWAVNAGVNIRLPMLAAGSQMWLNATYADGAISYTNVAGGGTLRRFTVPAFADAYLVGTSTRTTKAWILSGAIRHFWTPQVYSHLQGSFGKVDAPTGSGVRDAEFWQIGKTIGWTPVRDLLIAGEVTYTEARRQRFVGDPANFSRTSGRWGATLRIQRDF